MELTPGDARYLKHRQSLYPGPLALGDCRAQAAE